MHKKISVLRRYIACTRAATALEFAFVFPVFIILIFGTFECADALRVHNELSYAASRATRLVLIDDTISDADLETQLRAELERLDENALQVNLSTTTIDGQSYRVVEVIYPFEIKTPLFYGVSFNLSVTKGVPQNL